MSADLRDRTPRYFQANTVAVLLDPEGGEHQCNDITDERYDSGPRYWCAGMVGRSPQELSDRLWAAWWDESPDPENVYRRQLAAYEERWDYYD